MMDTGKFLEEIRWSRKRRAYRLRAGETVRKTTLTDMDGRGREVKSDMEMETD